MFFGAGRVRGLCWGGGQSTAPPCLGQEIAKNAGNAANHELKTIDKAAMENEAVKAMYPQRSGLNLIELIISSAVFSR